MQRKLSDLDRKIKRLRERYIIEEEISKDDYIEFHTRLSSERNEISIELERTGKKSSNLLDVVENCLHIASNLSALWDSGRYKDKQRLQKMVFPEGMAYDKQKDIVRTSRVN